MPARSPPFRAFWAHSRAEERAAFSSFLDYVADRRARYPGLHIYHYAAYEKSALRRLSMTHVLGEDAVDTLLREGVLVDLYEIVRRSLRISEKSYSIKSLEPLYMGADLRTGAIHRRRGLRGRLRRVLRRPATPGMMPGPPNCSPASRTTTSTTAAPPCTCVTGS
jgi:predicted RecB family nuclease